MNSQEWETLRHDQIGYYSQLRSELGIPLQDITDFTEWDEKIARMQQTIPIRNPDGSSTTFKGSAIIYGVPWKWHIIKEPFGGKLGVHKYIDDESGKVKEYQNEWAFLTLLTPVRNPNEARIANNFMKTYGDAFLSVLLRRCYDTLPNRGIRRG